MKSNLNFKILLSLLVCLLCFQTMFSSLRKSSKDEEKTIQEKNKASKTVKNLEKLLADQEALIKNEKDDKMRKSIQNSIDIIQNSIDTLSGLKHVNIS
mmetsp:Transcript_15519/g.16108  ORF Transcript_15519/g.16108 Transcript_15519/m.16108 type:complete len:98 (+) Transcript_15519:10-303(+)